jgi:hypothetical protein
MKVVFQGGGLNVRLEPGMAPGLVQGGSWPGLEMEEVRGMAGTVRHIGIHSVLLEENELITGAYSPGLKPALIAIGFFDTHVRDAGDEWHGFVGYVITNTMDRVRTESVLFLDDSGMAASAHELGGEALHGDGLDLIGYFKDRYPMEWERIEDMLAEYFGVMEEDAESDEAYLTILKEIPKEVRLASMHPGGTIDMKEVRLSNGSGLGRTLLLEDR